MVKKAKQQAESIAEKTGISINIAMTISNESLNEESSGLKAQLIGDVTDCDCIIIDDMLRTGDTVIGSAVELKKKGAKKIYAYIPHCKSILVNIIYSSVRY